jgi:hypothetical protein
MDVDASFHMEEEMRGRNLDSEFANVSVLEHENLRLEYEHLKQVHAEDLRQLRAEYVKQIADLNSKISFFQHHNTQLQLAIEEHTDLANVCFFCYFWCLTDYCLFRRPSLRLLLQQEPCASPRQA